MLANVEYQTTALTFRTVRLTLSKRAQQYTECLNLNNFCTVMNLIAVSRVERSSTLTTRPSSPDEQISAERGSR